MIFPQALDAERALLGGIVMDPAQIDEVSERVRAVDFYRPDHAEVFLMLQAMRAAGRHIDLITVTEQAARGGGDEKFGGLAYLIGLVEATPSTANLGHYATIIREKADRRRMIAGLQAAVADLADEGKPIEQVAAAVGVLTTEVGTGATIADEFAGYDELIPEVVNASIRATEGGRTGDGPLTPWSTLAPFRPHCDPGAVYIIAAGQKVGKSAAARQFAECAARQGYLVAVYSLEVPGATIARKTLSGEVKIDGRQIRQGLPADAWSRYDRQIADAAALPIRVARKGSFTPDELGASIRRVSRWAKANGQVLGLVVVDYFQLLTIGGGKGQNETTAKEDASRAIKIAARDSGACIILLSQLNREASKGGGPKASQLRGTSALESDADMVLLIARAEGAEVATFTIPLNRDNPPCPEGVELGFIGPQERFIDLNQVDL